MTVHDPDHDFHDSTTPLAPPVLSRTIFHWGLDSEIGRSVKWQKGHDHSDHAGASGPAFRELLSFSRQKNRSHYYVDLARNLEEEAAEYGKTMVLEEHSLSMVQHRPGQGIEVVPGVEDYL